MMCLICKTRPAKNKYNGGRTCGYCRNKLSAKAIADAKATLKLAGHTVLEPQPKPKSAKKGFATYNAEDYTYEQPRPLTSPNRTAVAFEANLIMKGATQLLDQMESAAKSSDSVRIVTVSYPEPIDRQPNINISDDPEGYIRILNEIKWEENNEFDLMGDEENTESYYDVFDFTNRLKAELDSIDNEAIDPRITSGDLINETDESRRVINILAGAFRNGSEFGIGDKTSIRAVRNYVADKLQTDDGTLAEILCKAGWEQQ